MGALALMASNSMSAELRAPIYVVELAVFTCPHCQALEAATRPLEQRLGEAFVFAPVAAPGAPAYLARAYYALRDELPQRRLRAALFLLARDMRFKPGADIEVIEWLRLRGLPVDAEKALTAMRGEAVAAAMERARRLAALAGVSAVPAMVVVTGGAVVTSVTKTAAASGAEFTREVLDVVKRLKKGQL